MMEQTIEDGAGDHGVAEGEHIIRPRETDVTALDFTVMHALPVGTLRTPQHAWRTHTRVLIVEDNLTNQTLIREQLRVLGIQSKQ
jgi:hypothetical protein